MFKKSLLLFPFLFCVFLTFTVSANAFTLIIDPGHGGNDPGAVKNGYIERNLNLQLSNRIREKMLPYADKVIMTRTSDLTTLSLEERTQFANRMGADLFVSIHHDSSTNPYVNGISSHYSTYRPALDTSGSYAVYNGKRYPYVDERKISGVTYIYINDNGTIKRVNINENITVYDPTPTLAAKKSGEISLEFADALASLGFKRMYTSTGSKDHNLNVTRWTTMPSVLIENGFLSNLTEALKVSSPTYQDKMATKIANTIIQYFNLNRAKLTSFQVDKVSPQKLGTDIKLSASATGTTAPLYKFWQYDGKEWILLKGYSSSNYVNWKPSKPGDYQLVVHAKSSSSTKSYDSYKTINYKVVLPEVTLETDKASPQTEYTNIKLSAVARVATNKLYKFWQFDGENWKVLQDYSPNSVYNWTPEKEDDYKLVVHMKDAASQKSYDYYHSVDYKINVKPLAITTDKPSPQEELSEINITANAGLNKHYRFWIYDGAEWTLLQNYSTANTSKWIPEKQGSYQVVVHVRDQSSSKSYDQYKVMKYEINPKSLQVTADKPSPQQENTTIEINAEGGKDDTYRFWQYNGNEWVLLQNYSADNTVTWRPSVPGDYQVVVHMRKNGSTASYEQYKVLKYTITQQPLEISVDKASPQYTNTAIKVSGNSGEGKLYRFWQFNGKEWIILQDYSELNSYIWQPDQEGQYKLVVHSKDKASTKSYDQYNSVDYTVKTTNDNEINTSVYSPQLVNSNISIEMPAVENRLYRYYIYDATSWTLLRNYSYDNSIEWIPNKAGTYQIVVHVKDAQSPNSYDEYFTRDYVIK